MSLNTEITRIENAKDDLKEAIEEMGGEVGDGTIDTYATAVRSIPTGVGTETDPVFTNSPAYGITSNDITNWNGKSEFSGSYNDLTNKPTIQDAFIVTMDANQNGLTASHTPAEIKEAIDSGKVAFLKNLFYITGEGQVNTLIPIVRVTSTQAIASSSLHDIESPNDNPGISTFIIDSQKNITDYDNYLLTSHQDITGKENISNKVTSISSSSTDTQYPSAKCVYDKFTNYLNDNVYIGFFPGSNVGISNISGSSYYKWILDEVFEANANGKFVILINTDAYHENIGDISQQFIRPIYICSSSRGSLLTTLQFECVYQVPASSGIFGAYTTLSYNKETATITKNSNGYTITTSNMGYTRAQYLSTNYSGNSVFVPTNNNHPANKKYVDDILLNIAPLYSSSSTYSVGDYVIYNNLLYKCNTAISSAEDWTSAHWTQTTVAEIIKNL